MHHIWKPLLSLWWGASSSSRRSFSWTICAGDSSSDFPPSRPIRRIVSRGLLWAWPYQARLKWSRLIAWFTRVPMPLMAVRLFALLIVTLSCHNSLNMRRHDAIHFVDFAEFTVMSLRIKTKGVGGQGQGLPLCWRSDEHLQSTAVVWQHTERVVILWGNTDASFELLSSQCASIRADGSGCEVD